MISSLELFSGAGGLAKGLELAGAKHRAFIEWNVDACKTLRMNYSPDTVLRRISGNSGSLISGKSI